MSPGMKSAIRGLAILTFALLVSGLSLAQTLAHRLILKDGSYQSITKYEVKGERVRYFSAERGEWEEVPKSLVDWDATEKYQQGLTTGAAAPEAAELDKELEAERKLAEARTPEVAPGLRLSDEGGVYLFDTFENQPQLVEIQQAGSDLNQHLKKNILRSAVNPLAGACESRSRSRRAGLGCHSRRPAAVAGERPVQDHSSADQGRQARRWRGQDHGHWQNHNRRAVCGDNDHHHDWRVGEDHSGGAAGKRRVRGRGDGWERLDELVRLGFWRKPERPSECVRVETGADRTSEGRQAQ